MRTHCRQRVLLHVLLLWAAACIIPSTPAAAQARGEQRAETAPTRLPLHFVANVGQTDTRVKFTAHGPGYDVFLTAEETVLTFAQADRRERSVLRMRFAGANAAPRLTGRQPQAATVNYFMGRDPERWRTRVPTYARVQVEGLYPGIDALFYGTDQRRLEYDLIVAPGVDPRIIGLQFDGGQGVRRGDAGQLRVGVGGQDVRFERPVAYQEFDGERRLVSAEYVVDDDGRVTFGVGAYDKTRPLVIDPVLSIAYSTLLGGSEPVDGAFTSGRGIAVDAAGNAYVAGYTNATDFPGAAPPAGVTSTFVAKIDPTGTILLYATYFGGTLAPEWTGGPATNAHDVAIDAEGRAYLTGDTSTIDLPVVNGFGAAPGGGSHDGFVAVFDTDGASLQYSSYIGGTSLDFARGIALAGPGIVCVVGHTESEDFPTKNAWRSLYQDGEAFALKIDTTAEGPASLIYSTLLGGPSYDMAHAVAADAAGNVYITGSTGQGGQGFPVVNGLTIGTLPPNEFEAYLAKFDSAGATLLYSTLLGGVGGVDFGRAVAVDGGGYVYVAGSTTAASFPIANPYQPRKASGTDAFVVKLDPRRAGDEALIYSTFLGGDDNGNGDEALAIAVDGNGNATVVGATYSANFPVLNDNWAPDNQPRYRSGGAFVARFNPFGVPSFISRFGEDDSLTAIDVAIDGAGNIFLTGEVYLFDGATSLPITPGALQSTLPHNTVAAFVTRIGLPADFGVSQIHPTVVGNGGDVAVTLQGFGFAAGVSVSLVRAGEAPIAGRVRSPGPDRLGVIFDLRGVAPGDYDVVITQPDGSTRVLQGQVHVEVKRPADMWVDIVGRPQFRGRETGTFTVLFGNRGNTIASGVMLKVSGIPDYVSVDLLTQVSTWLPPELEPHRTSLGPVIDTPEGKTMLLYLPLVPNGMTGFLRLQLTADAPPDDAEEFTLKASICQPYFGSPMTPAGKDCIDGITSMLIDMLTALFPELTPGVGCIKAIGELVASTLEAAVNNANAMYAGEVDLDFMVHAVGDMIGASLKAQLGCAGDVAGVVFPESILAQVVVAALQAIYTLYEASPACPPADVAELPIELRGSMDPNTKIGPVGAGPERFVSSRQPFGYAVYFENLATASAAAREVVIVDQIDPLLFDLESFRLGPIAFGSTQVIPPSNATTFTADVDLRPAQPLLVRIAAGLDSTTGVLTYRFETLDPVTGLPPDDLFAGFLPPNVNAPEGEGHVLFTISPRAGIADASEVANMARIYFDANDPIDTPVWRNTIDDSAPASAVAALPSTSVSPLTITWGGSDAGAGIDRYSIYISENGAPYTTLARLTTATSMALDLPVGNSYAFYSIAHDGADNAEAPKTLADASTSIVPADTTPPAIQPGVAGTLGDNGWYTSAVSVTWQLSDPESGVASSTGCTPLTLTGDTSGTAVTCSATNGVGLTSMDAVTVRIDRIAPLLTPPASITVGQTSAAGAMVTYAAPLITEAGSGLAASNCAPASGSIFPVGQTTVTCGATDHAGNASEVTFTVTVTASDSGWMFGAGSIKNGTTWHFVFSAGDRLPRLDDLLLLWSGARGHHFVATTMTAVFTDDPRFEPGTRARLDTVALSGTGVWNGRPGYTFAVVATDRGGWFSRDRFAIVIRDPQGGVVADVGGAVDAGAIESRLPLHSGGRP